MNLWQVARWHLSWWEIVVLLPFALLGGINMSNLKLPHWAQIALAIAGLVLGELLKASASGTLALAPWALQLIAVGQAVLGLFSSSVTAKPVDAVTKAAAKLSGVLLLLLAVGCTQLQAVFPTLDKIEQVVANDLAAGVSDEQMASDVCAALGGTSTTDAVCAGVTQILADTIQFLLDSGVLKGQAVARAHAFQAKHAAAGH